jgi:hypothetical protein
VSRRSGAVSDDTIASEVAEASLLEGGTAIGAAAAGFFAAAAQRPGVLLAPLTVLVAGVGLGGRALDGRLRQPGLGARRPRGFMVGEAIPPAARVAAPASITAMLVALAYDDGFRLGAVLAPALRIARAAGADGRAHVLERIVAIGARALSEGAVARALLAVAGPPEGGLLSPDDLSASVIVDHEAADGSEGELRTIRAPWADDGEATASGCTGHGILTMDSRGFTVAVAYGEALDGVDVPELGLRFTRGAVPVLRGVTRIAPGTVLAAPAPVSIGVRDGEPIEARYEPAAAVEGARVAALGLRRDARTRRVDVVRG